MKTNYNLEACVHYVSILNTKPLFVFRYINYDFIMPIYVFNLSCCTITRKSILNNRYKKHKIFLLSLTLFTLTWLVMTFVIC